MSDFHYDYSKRGYLLPSGCKDLIDALNLVPNIGGPIYWTKFAKHPGGLPVPEKKPLGVLTIPDEITVAELAMLLGKKPFKIVADLWELNIFANLNDTVAFKFAAKILWKYGFIAGRAA